MIKIKSEKEIKVMAANGRILARIMEELKKMVRPGLKTKELDEVAEKLILKEGAKPSFKNYRGVDDLHAKPFPNSLCVSLNEEIVHGLPSERVLKEGEIVSLDLGLVRYGFHVDMAITLAIGTISPEAARLIRITKKCLKLAIKKAKVGNTFGDVGNAVERYAESQGFGVIRELCGHGIGRELHEEPQILNCGKRKTGPKIKNGMVFCLEPMLSLGDWQIKRSANGSYLTRDHSLSAHFEHTIAIINDRAIVLTEI